MRKQKIKKTLEFCEPRFLEGFNVNRINYSYSLLVYPNTFSPHPGGMSLGGGWFVRVEWYELKGFKLWTLNIYFKVNLKDWINRSLHLTQTLIIKLTLRLWKGFIFILFIIESQLIECYFRASCPQLLSTFLVSGAVVGHP